jgi:hypothetical protein
MRCRVGTKAAGLQKCYECWLMEQPPEIQEEDAERRLGCVPEGMRRARIPAADWPVGRRWCAACQSFRRLQECTGSRCTVCVGIANRNAYLMRTYIIHGRPFTEDDYKKLFEKQGGRCRICGRRSVTKRLAVDHDHKTMRVRGLLCPGEYGCNFAVLGNIKDLEMARAIVAYLEKNYAESIIPQ